MINISLKKSSIHICLSHFENESRILKQTKGLIDNNIVQSVLIIALWKQNLAQNEQIDKSRFVHRIKPRFFNGGVPPRGLGTLIKHFRLIFHFLEILKVIRQNKPALVNLHNILLLPLVPLIKLVSARSKLIYDAHELETETNGLHGFKKGLFKIYERLFIKSFTYVFVVSPSIEQWYRNTYGITNISTILNCPVPQDIKKHNYFREELGISEDSLIYLYQGGLSRGRGIEVLLEAFKKINDPKYSVVFMGYGVLENMIVSASKEHSNIFFYRAVAPDIVLNYTSSADFGVSLIENVCLSYYYCLPNKVFEYLMAGLPCIVSDMLELRSYIETNKVGIICDITTSETIMKSVMDIANLNRDQLKAAIEIIQPKYNWINEEKKMIDVYHQLNLG